jgi:hypothetical protein
MSSWHLPNIAGYCRWPTWGFGIRVSICAFPGLKAPPTHRSSHFFRLSATAAHQPGGCSCCNIPHSLDGLIRFCVEIRRSDVRSIELQNLPFTSMGELWQSTLERAYRLTYGESFAVFRCLSSHYRPERLPRSQHRDEMSNPSCHRIDGTGLWNEKIEYEHARNVTYNYGPVQYVHHHVISMRSVIMSPRDK